MPDLYMCSSHCQSVSSTACLTASACLSAGLTAEDDVKTQLTKYTFNLYFCLATYFKEALSHILTGKANVEILLYCTCAFLKYHSMKILYLARTTFKIMYILKLEAESKLQCY